MTEAQKILFEEIHKRWHTQDDVSAISLSQAAFDIGTLSGIVLAQESEIAELARHL